MENYKVGQLLAIACGGALGAVSRFGLQQWISTLYNGRFPVAIFLANSLGSLCLGLVYVLITEKGMLPETWRPFIMIGLLGAFTTFSTFSLDSLRLMEQGYWMLALSNIIANVAFGLFGAFVGMSVGRWLWVN